MLLGVLADETYSYQTARAAMAEVEFSANDRPLRLMRPFTVSFYRLVTRYPASTFRHYLASYAAIEDAEAMEVSSLVSRLRGVHELGLPFSIMCDDVLPSLRDTWIWEHARCGADAPPQRLAALAAAQDITNIAMLEADSDTAFFRSHGVNYPWDLRVPGPPRPTAPAQPVACFAMNSQVLPSPEEAPIEELSPLSDSGVALAGLLFGDDSCDDDDIGMDLDDLGDTSLEALSCNATVAAESTYVDDYTHEEDQPPPMMGTSFDLDFAYVDAWTTAVIDLTVPDTWDRPWGDPWVFYTTLLW